MRFPPEILSRCWFLAGPTASGKTPLGIELASLINAEIISLDSMTIFQGMDIGTAKPTPDQRRAIPHHLLDLILPSEEFSVAQYLSVALAICHDLLHRGKTPLFVGGTGLYLRSLLRGVFQGPPADWDFRHRLESWAASQEPLALHRRLAEIDPPSAQRLHPSDTRRIIRALEVHHLTGLPLSHHQQEQPLPPEHRPRHVYWLDPPRIWLHQRINLRVDEMLAAGLVDEVRHLLAAQPPPGRTARQALGYKEVIDHLEGKTTAADMRIAIQTRTRQFAKRQCTWFRNLVECHPIPISGLESPAELARTLAAKSSLTP